MKSLVRLLMILILCVGLYSHAAGEVRGRGPNGSVLVSRLKRLVPKAYLTTPERVTVQSMSAEEMAGFFGTSNVLAFYTSDTNEIYIRSDLKGYDRDSVLVHEYGHFVWYNVLGIRERQAYERIWKDEAFAKDEYRTASVKEGFAEAFSYYVCNEYVCQHYAENAFIRDVERRLKDWLRTTSNKTYKTQEDVDGGLFSCEWLAGRRAGPRVRSCYQDGDCYPCRRSEPCSSRLESNEVRARPTDLYWLMAAGDPYEQTVLG